jgi:hypothetical protein
MLYMRVYCMTCAHFAIYMLTRQQQNIFLQPRGKNPPPSFRGWNRQPPIDLLSTAIKNFSTLLRSLSNQDPATRTARQPVDALHASLLHDLRALRNIYADTPTTEYFPAAQREEPSAVVQRVEQTPAAIQPIPPSSPAQRVEPVSAQRVAPVAAQQVAPTIAQRVAPNTAQRVTPRRAKNIASKPQSTNNCQTRAAVAAPTHVHVSSPITEYETPVSEVILSLAQTKRQLEGKTYFDPDEQEYYTVRKVRLYKNTGHIVADIYPVGKPLIDSLAPIHVADVIRMLATTPPVTRLASAIKASTLSSNSNRFTLLADDDEDDDDDEQESTVSAPFAVRDVP